jgi:hypothetical protein
MWRATVFELGGRPVAGGHAAAEASSEPVTRASSPAAAAAVRPATAPTPLFASHRGQHGRLSLLVRAAIVVFAMDGQPRSVIAAKCGTTLHSVRAWIQHWHASGDLADTPHARRPRCTDEWTDTLMAFCARIVKFITPRQIVHQLDLDCSARTVDRRLIEAGLPGRVAQHKYAFTQEQKDDRVKWSRAHLHWTKEQWRRVIWSDEKKVLGYGFSGQIWVRRPPGEALNPEYTVPHLPHPVQVHCWGCFCGRGLGRCHIYTENMDAVLLRRILDTHLIQTARQYFDVANAELWYYQHDNPTVYTGHVVQEWIHNHGVQKLPFPKYSPDLNPQENVWAYLARRIEALGCRTEDELKAAIACEWERIPLSFLQSLTDSMPERCQRVIDAHGDHIHY